MSKLHITSIIVAVVLMVGTVLIACSTKATPKILPPTSSIEGLTYGEWLAKWWKYALEAPVEENPISGETGNNCVYQRIGNVGLVLANSSLDKPIECEVPTGMMLFVEVLGAECSTLEEAPFYGGNEEELRACAQAFVPQDLEVTIDGVEVKDLNQFFITSPMYEITEPENNILAVPAGTTGQSLGSGVYLMLSQLSAGKHTIYLRGTYPSFEYTAEKTFNLTVTS